jgi:hypothetical protein
VFVLVVPSIAAPFCLAAVHERVALFGKVLARGAALFRGVFQKVSAVRDGVTFVIRVGLDQTKHARVARFLNHRLHSIRYKNVHVLVREEP